MDTLRSILFGTALFAVSFAACAEITEGRTAIDRAYVAGGVGLEESERLTQMADKYP
jgi:hypothetical protein